MLRLPSLMIAGKIVRLPLSEVIGWRLAAVLATSPADRLETTQLLRDDPALLLWLANSVPQGWTWNIADLAPQLIPLLAACRNDWQSAPLADDSCWLAWQAHARQLGANLSQLQIGLESSLPSLAAEVLAEDHNPESPPRLLARILRGIVSQLKPAERVQLPLEAAVERAKQQALYQFAYGLSHEINNPLANIASRAQTLLHDETDPDRKKKLNTINAQAFRAHEMLADLMLYAKPPALCGEEVDVTQVITRVVDELLPRAREQQTELHWEAAASVRAWCDRTQLAVAIKAVVQNALEAFGEGGRIEISLLANDDQITLEVTDNGPGIPPDQQAFIFDPFFSGREAGRGLGLGLSKAWRIMELHRGEIRCQTASSGGTRFTLAWPRKQS